MFTTCLNDVETIGSRGNDSRSNSPGHPGCQAGKSGMRGVSVDHVYKSNDQNIIECSLSRTIADACSVWVWLEADSFFCGQDENEETTSITSKGSKKDEVASQPSFAISSSYFVGHVVKSHAKS